MNQLSKDILVSVRKLAQEEGLCLQEAIGIYQLHELVRINKQLEETHLYIKGIDEGVEETNYLLDSAMDSDGEYKNHLRIRQS